MKHFDNQILSSIIDQVLDCDITPLREFLTSNPSQPLICTGSGGAETAGDLAALLYGARGGVATAVSPYTLNSYSDTAIKTSKLLILSAGGHNNDAIFAAKRGLSVNPIKTASFSLHAGYRNEVDKLFDKAGSKLSFITPVASHDGFVSVGTPIAYFALLCRAFDPGCDITKVTSLPQTPYVLTRNDNTPLTLSDFSSVSNFIILHGSWGRPVAYNLEGKLVESGMASGSVYDYRNFCHGRFIYTSQHLDNSAVVMFVSPRERDIARRTREYLPASTKLIIIETAEDAPVASLDLLVRMTHFWDCLCEALDVNHVCPANPGRIDKRVPMWIPFIAEMKKNGPLSIL